MNEIAESNIPTNLAANLPADSTANLPAAPTAPTFTPGWKTSEFWLTALGQAGVVLASVSGGLPPRYAATAVTLSQVAYSLSRGIAKVNAAR